MRPDLRKAIAGETSTFLLALQFLTRLPLPFDVGYTPERMAATPRYYPLVGAMIGAILAIIYVIASGVWSSQIAAVLSVSIGLLVTGAFHEDGLADTFDGIGGAPGRDKMLAIMRDSRIGTYGGAALFVSLGLQVILLSDLSVGTAVIALVAGHGLSRLSAVIVIATGRYAREEGTGKPVANGVGKRSLFVAIITGFGLCAIMVLGVSVRGVMLGLLGLLTGHVFLRILIERRLGGYTGDTLGAVQQASLIGLWLGLAV